MVTNLGNGLWGYEREHVMKGGIAMPLRASFARLADGSICVYSPNTDDRAVMDAVAALGPVAHLVAPCTYHHLYVTPWAERFPNARVWAAPGLRTKRADIAWTDDLPRTGEYAFDSDLTAMAIAGAESLGETVMFHRPSGALLVADLVFHLLQPKGFVSNLAFTMMGVRNKLAQSRAWRMITKDRDAACESAKRVMALPFERLVPSHGPVVDEDAKGRLRTALRWMLRE